MKHLKILPLLLLLFITSSAEAHEGRNCLEKASRFDGLERTIFLKGCLASASAPANMQESALQNKRSRCQQNAKNRALRGGEKTDYIKACIRKNEAAEVATARKATSTAVSRAEIPAPATIATPSAKAVDEHNCAYQSSKIDMQYRSAYLKACLEWASSPANVQEAALQSKRLRCEQNAKNLALQGDGKSAYINTCLTKNEAAEKRAATHAPSSLASTAGTDSSRQ